MANTMITHVVYDKRNACFNIYLLPRNLSVSKISNGYFKLRFRQFYSICSRPRSQNHSIMAEEAQIEENLDRDFLLFMSLTKTYFPQLVNKRDVMLCTQWLSKLCGEKVQGISQKRNRNLYLSHLLMNMQEGKMGGPFLKPPSDGSLPTATAVFGPPPADESITDEAENMIGGTADDFQERSADGRTYVATRCLPDNRGTYAFVALNIDKKPDRAEDTTIIPCSTNKSKLEHIKALHDLTTFSLNEHPTESQMEAFYIRNIEAKASGDIVQLYDQLKTDLHKPCGRDKDEVDYYDVLLKQIDDEIRGPPSGENDLVNFLVSRLSQDLKKVTKMGHIFQLKPDQQNLKILEILRQKLVVRQQEEKRRYLLAEMEECMMASAAPSESCMGGHETTESMWKLAVTRPPAETDVARLFGLYQPEAVGAFLDILAEDKQAILRRGKRRESSLIESIRSEVYKEVQFGKAEYNKARAVYREWNEILSHVEEIMYLTTNEVIDEVPKQNEQLLANMIANIKQTENLVVEEAQRGEMLTEKISDANEWKFSTYDDGGKNASWDIKTTIDNMRNEVESYKLLIQNQSQRIKQLRDQLDYQ